MFNAPLSAAARCAGRLAQHGALQPPADSLRYGGRFVAERSIRFGLVAIGYADGYPRSASIDAAVSIGGHTSHVIGRVSMVMLTVDVDALPSAGIGSTVEP